MQAQKNNPQSKFDSSPCRGNNRSEHFERGRILRFAVDDQGNATGEHAEELRLLQQAGIPFQSCIQGQAGPKEIHQCNQEEIRVHEEESGSSLSVQRWIPALEVPGQDWSGIKLIGISSVLRMVGSSRDIALWRPVATVRKVCCCDGSDSDGISDHGQGTFRGTKEEAVTSNG